MNERDVTRLRDTPGQATRRRRYERLLPSSRTTAFTTGSERQEGSRKAALLCFRRQRKLRRFDGPSGSADERLLSAFQNYNGYNRLTNSSTVRPACRMIERSVPAASVL